MCEKLRKGSPNKAAASEENHSGRAAPLGTSFVSATFRSPSPEGVSVRATALSFISPISFIALSKPTYSILLKIFFVSSLFSMMIETTFFYESSMKLEVQSLAL